MCFWVHSPVRFKAQGRGRNPDGTTDGRNAHPDRGGAVRVPDTGGANTAARCANAPGTGGSGGAGISTRRDARRTVGESLPFLSFRASGSVGCDEAVSRILSAPLPEERIIYLSDRTRNLSRLRATRSGPLLGSLFGLAPDGVFRAASLALRAVGSYPTFSPLPAP